MHYLLRHGETNFNEKGLIQGHSPLSRLTLKGKEQVEQAARWLAEKVPCFDQVVCSDLVRAQESWEIVGRHIHHLRFSLSEALRERGHGPFEGHPYDNADWGQNLERPGVETRASFELRVREFFDSLDPSQSTLVISHGGVLEYRLRQMGMDRRVANGEVIRFPDLHGMKPNL